MSKVSVLPNSIEKAPSASADLRLEGIVTAIKALLASLSPAERAHVLAEIAGDGQLNAPRAGAVLSTIVQLLPHRQEWTVREVKQRVEEALSGATAKEIYNALGYLNRTGQVRRLGYGRYSVSGVEIVTSDDLGGEPLKGEDN